MLMLLGRLYISGRNVVYLTVKPDFGTKYEDMASYFAPDSCIINLRPGGRNIDPLQIILWSAIMFTRTTAIYRPSQALMNSFSPGCDMDQLFLQI